MLPVVGSVIVLTMSMLSFIDPAIVISVRMESFIDPVVVLSTVKSVIDSKEIEIPLHISLMGKKNILINSVEICQ
jgi:hypothetical protein